MSSTLLRTRARILSHSDSSDDAESAPLFIDDQSPQPSLSSMHTIAGRWRWLWWCSLVHKRAGDNLAVMILWLSMAAAAYWMSALVPGLAVFALTLEINDRPGGGPYTTKALLSIARAAAMPVGFGAALVGPLRRAAVDGWRRPLSLMALPLVYGIVPNVAFALGTDSAVAIGVQLAARFAGTAVISLAFCAYLACVQGRRASDVIMPIATLSILLAPAVSRPLSAAVADWLAEVGDGSDSDGHLWMPAAVSALCIVPTLVAALALASAPLPNATDVDARAPTDLARGTDGEEQATLPAGANGAWFRRHWAIIVGLALSSAALQGLGAVRDVFTADLVGPDAPWWHSVLADAPACAVACLFYVPLLWVDDNRRAFGIVGVVGALSAVVLAGAGVASLAGWISPLAFLVVGGVGHFFALVPFSGGGIVFERLMGASGMPVDTLLVNVACQVPAYVAGLGVLLLAPAATHPTAFFGWTSVLCGGLLCVSCLWTLVAAFCMLPSSTVTDGAEIQATLSSATTPFKATVHTIPFVGVASDAR
jgi:hypothetical protein